MRTAEQVVGVVGLGSSWNTGVSVSVLGEAVPLNREHEELAAGSACWWRGLLQLNYALAELKYQIMGGKEKDLIEKEGNQWNCTYTLSHGMSLSSTKWVFRTKT